MLLASLRISEHVGVMCIAVAVTGTVLKVTDDAAPGGLMTHRREFLLRTAGGLGALWTQAGRLSMDLAAGERLDVELASGGQSANNQQIAGDERFWAKVRRD
jgi:hypothetical protein